MGYGEYQDAVRTGQWRHQCYLREAEVARMRTRRTWRARTAGALRAWAERLEPGAPRAATPNAGRAPQGTR